MNEELFHLLVDNQKCLWDKLHSNDKLESYDELKTSSLINGIYVSEENTVIKKENGDILYVVTKRIGKKVHKYLHGTIKDENIEKNIYLNTRKNDFEKIWNEHWLN